MKSRRSLPRKDWPAADLALFAGLLRKGSLLEDAGAYHEHRPTSLRSIKFAYACWLAWLTTDEPRVLLIDPPDRAIPDRLFRWIASMVDLSPPSQLSLVTAALGPLFAAAPDRNWVPQRRILARLNLQAKRHDSTRKTGRIIHSRTLFDAGLTLMSNAGMGAEPVGLSAARQRRDGAMVAVLSLLPQRRLTYCNLEIGRHFCGSWPYEIHVTPDISKTGMAWSARVPTDLEPVLADYLTFVRPCLAARSRVPDCALWLNDHGVRLAPNTMTGRITEATRRVLGVGISPHLFRDAAATTLVFEDPANSQVVRPLLDHRYFSTAERHYMHTNSLDAGRRYATMMRQTATETKP